MKRLAQIVRNMGIAASLSVVACGAQNASAIFSKALYDSQGFEAATLGPINGQAAGVYDAEVGNTLEPGVLGPAGTWSVTGGSPATSANIVDIGGVHGQVLSFGPSGPSFPDVDARVNYEFGGGYSADLGSIVESNQFVRVSYSFFQDVVDVENDFVGGDVMTWRNQDVVEQANMTVEGGDIQLRLRKGSPLSAINFTDTLEDAYTLGEWHDIDIILEFPDLNPIADEIPIVQVWLDGTELTAGDIYYGHWAGFLGWSDSASFRPIATAGATYYVDDMSVLWGDDSLVPTGPDPIDGDINGDGFVGIADLNIVLGNWNAGTPPATGTPTIPEPASFALLALGSIAMFKRRRS
jgi:PEP-CTERM motif